MTNQPLSLFFYIAICVISGVFFWRTFQKGAPDQRRKMVFATIGAVWIAGLAILLHSFRR
jgi:hypothetical protein